MIASLPIDEDERLDTLNSYSILDAEPEQRFDDITILMSKICDAPIALISLIDQKRQWFLSRVGLDLRETDRQIAFCAHAILGNQTMHVPDARLDERFQDNPFVTNEPGIVFYVGALLKTSDGKKLGTLCALDFEPRWLEQEQLEMLEALARQVVNLFEARRNNNLLRKEIRRRRNAERVKSSFLSRMSHEIRTPLNIIIGVHDALAEKPERQLDLLDTARRASLGLKILVDDVLDYARLEAEHQLTVKAEPVELQGLLEHLYSIFRLPAEQKKIDFNAVFGHGVPAYVLGDEDRLSQVLMVLLGNAFKYTSQGKIILSLELKSLEGEQAHLQFQVMDTGSGIPENQRENIFRSFGRVDESNSREFGGSGLGLSIAQQLVRIMGGEITVESANEEGATFQFTLALPIIGMPSSTNNQDKVKTEVKEGLHLLVVEDNLENQSLIKVLFKERNTEFEFADNGSVGLDKFRAGAYDLVLMDMQMPEMDGLATTRAIRKWEKEQGNRRTPVIAFTANHLPEDFSLCQQSGCDDIVTKPFLKGELFQKINNLTNRIS